MRQQRSDAKAHLLRLLLPLVIPVLCLCTALRLEMNSPRLYIEGFERYNVESTTGLSADQLEAAAARLIRYFNSLDTSPQMQVTLASGRTSALFHDYEVVHLADVKRLFGFNSSLQAVSLLALVAMVAAGLASGHRREVAAALHAGALMTLALLAVTAGLFMADFDWMFTGFHLVAFDNMFWQLDPRVDYLVMLFPWGFWQDMSLIAGAATGLAAGSLLALARRLGRDA